MGNFEPRCSYKIVLTSKSVYFFYFLPLVSAWLNIRSQATLESMAASLLIQASRNSRLRFATTGHSAVFSLWLYIGWKDQFYISYISVGGFYVEENTADIRFLKYLDGKKEKLFSSIWQKKQ